jgi:exopolyphosphatase/guanosine-5'-triphosphate,3'-diphosphate pyrophosphatase
VPKGRSTGAISSSGCHRETGIALDIIAPEEEARLAMLGCHRLLEPGDGPALIFDIGGGSTELVLIDTDGVNPKIKCWWSAPWGVVSLTESEGKDFADAKRAAGSLQPMRERVRHAFPPLRGASPQGEEQYPPARNQRNGDDARERSPRLAELRPRAVDGLKMPAESMRAISTMISGMSLAERAELPCIGLERADLVTAGCAILDAIMDIWPAKTLGVADRGIREGILRSLMARDGHKI